MRQCRVTTSSSDAPAGIRTLAAGYETGVIGVEAYPASRNRFFSVPWVETCPFGYDWVKVVDTSTARGISARYKTL